MHKNRKYIHRIPADWTKQCNRERKGKRGQDSDGKLGQMKTTISFRAKSGEQADGQADQLDGFRHHLSNLNKDYRQL